MSEPEVLAENVLSIEGGDKLESGLLVSNPGPDERPVAYAKLGKTTVMLYRDTKGRVVIEIDDMSEGDVYVTANLQSLITTGDMSDDDDLPWTGMKLMERGERP